MRERCQSSPSSSHLPTDSALVSVLIIAELARGCRWNRNLEPNFCLGRDLNAEPLDWQSSTLTTRLPCYSYFFVVTFISNVKSTSVKSLLTQCNIEMYDYNVIK